MDVTRADMTSVAQFCQAAHMCARLDQVEDSHGAIHGPDFALKPACANTVHHGRMLVTRPGRVKLQTFLVEHPAPDDLIRQPDRLGIVVRYDAGTGLATARGDVTTFVALLAGDGNGGRTAMRSEVPQLTAAVIGWACA